MQSSKHNAITPTETESATDNDQLTVHSPQYPLLAKYVNDHKLPGSAANDPHELALAGFLREHMQKRANTPQESTDNNRVIFDKGD